MSRAAAMIARLASDGANLLDGRGPALLPDEIAIERNSDGVMDAVVWKPRRRARFRFAELSVIGELRMLPSPPESGVSVAILYTGRGRVLVNYVGGPDAPMLEEARATR